MVDLKAFTIITSYDDCPLDTELLVWTGDSFDVEFVVQDTETGSCYAANRVDFEAFIELPASCTANEYFEGKCND